ncbi:MAG TPA: enoyl-CoA hydratase/isomerase family protein [Bryobacteraceae bacterium]|nr:enoyl-CoA hydratase/isomerase family protein [Bryobacteraceae bacterium]
MPTSTSLQVEREGRVLRLTLSRPDKRNALSAELCHAIVAAIESAAGDSTVGAVLVGAQGNVFCAGMDLTEIGGDDAPELTAIHERLFTLGLRVAVPIVMAVRGPALGGGVGLLANGHIVVAAQGATFALSEIRIGMWPFVIFGALAVAIGERRALALSLTGRVFSVQEALQWGLVHEIAQAVEVEDRAHAVAQHLASLSRPTIRAGLKFANETRDQDHVAAASAAARYRAAAFASADFAEGVRAFREKRAPRWPSLGE